MRIEQIKIQKFKVLKNFEQDFAGKSVIITGENGKGKSSILQFIRIALGDTSNVPPEAEGAGMVIALKDGKKYIFKVQFKNNKPVIEITSPDGFKDTRKGVLQQIVGAVDFDVNEFVELSDTEGGRKKQVKIYKELLDKETIEHITRLENEVQRYYDDRTELNREIKTLQGFISKSPFYGEDLEINPIDVKAIELRLTEATAHNKKIDEILLRSQQREEKINANSDAISRMKAEIERLEKENEEMGIQNRQAAEWVKENAMVNTDALTQQLSDASETNVKAAQIQELRERKEQLKNYEDRAREFTLKIETKRQIIQDAIRDMNTPIPGLSFDNDQLLYKGVPVSTASLSTSEIIELGTFLKMVQNPEAPLFIDNAESIGVDRMKLLLDIANENKLQVIFAEVQRGQEELKVEIIGE